MERFLRDFVRRRRSKASIRRKAALEKAAREMKLLDSQEASIWKSGKGGGHHDRV
jgi:hypothetical protein